MTSNLPERDRLRRRIRKLARDRLGYAELRAGQLEAVESVVGGRDTLCVMATGSGKTAIYELAGLLLDGPTLVISPLIALQRDQVDSLIKGSATLLNSTLGERAREAALEEAEEGAVEFLLMAPEQLANHEVLSELRAAGPSLFVVDEAHCVSEWGHDFRPDYLGLADAIDAVGRPPVLALTATAAPPVRADILRALRMADPEVIVRGFDRPNIHLAVRRFHDAQDKRAALIEAVKAADPPGIVYVATRRASEEIAEELRQAGVRASAYHAGLAPRRRAEVQEAFMHDADCDVMVATVAFGMGVDKPNVRWVFHEAVSDSLDSYHQEIGRAGRDGEPARALLFYRPEDLGLRRFFAGGQLPGATIERVATLLSAAGGPVDPATLNDAAEGISRSALTATLHRLEQVGFAEVHDDGTVEAVESAQEIGHATEQAEQLETSRHDFDRSRIEMVRGYAERHGCRRAFLLGYFGEDLTPPCGNCDNDERPAASHAGWHEAAAGRDLEGPHTGDRVVHGRWGAGTVAHVEDGEITVIFDGAGYKTLDAGLVRERGLLAPE